MPPTVRRAGLGVASREWTTHNAPRGPRRCETIFWVVELAYEIETSQTLTVQARQTIHNCAFRRTVAIEARNDGGWWLTAGTARSGHRS